MVQTSQLRIGNLVLYKNKITSVSSIDTNSIKFKNSDLKYECVNDMDIQPLRLVIDMFSVDTFNIQENVVKLSDDIYISFKNNDPMLIIQSAFDSYCIPVNYIHELQNLFYALLKLELHIHLKNYE